MSDLKYGVRMSVLSLGGDHEDDNEFRHPTEKCHGCLRLVISPVGSGRGKPIVCEECLDHIRVYGSLPSVVRKEEACLI